MFWFCKGMPKHLVTFNKVRCFYIANRCKETDLTISICLGGGFVLAAKSNPALLVPKGDSVSKIPRNCRRYSTWLVSHLGATHREIFFKTGYFSTLAILGLKGVTGSSFQSCAADDCSEHTPSEAQLWKLLPVNFLKVQRACTVWSAALKTAACQTSEEQL